MMPLISFYTVVRRMVEERKFKSRFVHVLKFDFGNLTKEETPTSFPGLFPFESNSKGKSPGNEVEKIRKKKNNIIRTNIL